MDYIYDFSLVSIAFLSVTAFFYARQPKVPSMRNTLFGIMLFLGVFFAFMDALVVIIEPYAYQLPAFVVYAANALLLISVQLSTALFFSYSLALTDLGKNAIRLSEIFSFMPFAAIAIMIILPLGSSGIFYLDELNIYRRGDLYLALYIVSAIYLLASLLIILIRRKQLSPLKILCILGFVGLCLIAMLIQYTKPEYLLNSTANALALTLIYHELEAPNARVDSLTGVLNRAAFPLIVRESLAQNKRCTLFLLPLVSLRPVSYSMGTKTGEMLLIRFAESLSALFPGAYVFHLSQEVFAVIQNGGEYVDAQALETKLSALPDAFHSGSAILPVDVKAACINSEDAPDHKQMLSLSDYILQLWQEGSLQSLLVVDDAFKARLQKAEELEKKLEESISSGRIQVYYQPLHDGSGKLTALEALVRLFDADGNFLPTQEAVELAEKNGSIHRMGDIVLEKVCAFISENNAGSWGLHHIGVNLSALQFMRDDLCEDVTSIMDKYNIDHSIVSFEITETASASVADVARNMKKMNAAGFSFLLDDFGKGYANFSNIARLPLLCVKIDKMILWESKESSSKMAFLRGVVDLLHSLHLTSVCEGVETLEQAQLLTKLGVDMQQGYLYSRPLPPEELLKYIARGEKA